jgi:hypothetical protein
VLTISCINLLNVKPINAESISPPAIPQFTLRYVKASYNIIDPYTGVSKQVDNSTISIIIKNQPFNKIYNAMDNSTTSLYYNVQVKGHYAENWTEVFNSINYSYPLSNMVYTWYNYAIQSDSAYTVISIPVNYPIGSQVDFRVQGVIANQTEIIIPNFIPNPIRGGDYTLENVMFIIQTSDWSNAQTLTIPENQTQTPNQESQQPDLTIIVGVAIVTVVLGAGIGLLIYLAKRK